jgi:hypothetical protein
MASVCATMDRFTPDLADPYQQKCNHMLNVVERQGKAQDSSITGGCFDQERIAVVRRSAVQGMHDREDELACVHERTLVTACDAHLQDRHCA